jgi:localization factor PodJL
MAAQPNGAGAKNGGGARRGPSDRRDSPTDKAAISYSYLPVRHVVWLNREGTAPPTPFAPGAPLPVPQRSAERPDRNESSEPAYREEHPVPEPVADTPLPDRTLPSVPVRTKPRTLSRYAWPLAIVLSLAGAGALVYQLTTSNSIEDPSTAGGSVAVALAPAPQPLRPVQPPAAAAIPATPAPLAPDLAELRRAAAAGDAVAEYELGVRYVTGRGFERDTAEGARWIERAALKGLAPAQYNFGVMYERGLGVQLNDDVAIYWYRLAANQGHPRAQHNLATAFARGRGTKQDFAAAAEWYGRAAAAGIAESQHALGIMYEQGSGVPKDTERALALYRAAAGQGHVGAAENAARLVAGIAPAGTPTDATASRTASTSAVATPMTRETIAEIQRILYRLDFDPGAADGVAGTRTVAAIKLYQKFAGLPEDGKPSAALLEDLREVATDKAIPSR